MIGSLESFSGAFLYTHIDTEGLMQGIPMDTVRSLRSSTRKQLIVAGGIATSEQIDQLDAMKIDAVVGMAIYTGKVKLVGPLLGHVHIPLSNQNSIRVGEWVK
jgi:phosphoribosylformimino-5-aminoimidazole carboxamide ribotide isomerase